MPRRSYLASPTQLRQSYYKLLSKGFQSMVKGESGALGCMSAIAESLLLRGDEVDAKQLYAEALQELYDEADYYSNLFRLDVTALGNDLAAQLQALVNTRGIYLEVFEFDDYRGGAKIPKPETFESRELGPVAVVSIMRDGDEYFALEPFPEDDPEESPVSSPLSGSSVPPLNTDDDEEKQPSSVEKMKSWIWPSTEKSKSARSSAFEADASTPAISTPGSVRTPPRKGQLDKSSSKKNLAGVFGDDISTAQTVQTGSGARKRLLFSKSNSNSAAARKSSAAEEKKKIEAPRRSGRIRNDYSKFK